ncbi:cytochrome b [Tabrizicola sp.]|uniref:cytochrome b n=1 Tax=Tabrizicola sp. TaxID=2005166 RepID=UPI0035AE8F88
MGLKNGPEEFGLVTRLFHWTMMLLILGQLALGLRLANLEPGLANVWLYGLHKTLGFLALALILLRIAWHLASPPPLPLGPRNALFRTARAVHRAIYLLLVALPLTGWAGSSATGIDVMIADRWIVPPLVRASEQAETFWFGLHRLLAFALIGLVALHILGALKHGIERDDTLARMIRGRA